MIPNDVVKKVLESVDHEELLNLTAEMVKINSVWDPIAGTGEQEAAEHVARWAKQKGFQVQVDQVAPGRPNVIVSWDAGPGERKLMFEGHTDVVTPGDVETWHYDPFGAQIEGGRMYGRGTNDTKGNLCAMLIAMDALKRAGVPLSGGIVGGVLCDEEDLMLGVLDFIEKGHADDVTGAIICEPQDGLVCTSQKGAIRASYTIGGRMSHGAMPLSGLNTAPALAELINGLHRLERAAVEKLGRDRHLGWASFTPTVIQAPSGGAAQLNVMPGEARLLVDVRTIPGQDHASIRNDLTALAEATAKKVADDYAAYDRQLRLERDHRMDVQVEFLTDRPCTKTDANDPVVAAAAWATRRVLNAEPEYAGVPGATDGTFLWAMKGIPIVTMGAGDRQVPHQKDEWVDINQLKETADTYALAALHYLTPSND
ncbi:MAG: M20 family metallopeptidase [Deltaproteobacteria bacterium]|nr:M20 family metallopeptidase [Deltaproteobacteria bacterium]